MMKRKASPEPNKTGRLTVSRKTGLFFLLALACALAFSSASFASVSAGYSEYYIPGDEDDMMLILDTIGAGDQTTNGMHSIISVVAGSPSTVVYYDHWENGYNFDKNNPAATADEIVTLANRGDSNIFESSNIPIPRTNSMTSCGGNPCYDGRDHIYVAGGATTVTRSSWTEMAGTLLAVAWEVYPVRPQLTTYILPFGEDLYTSNTLRDFERVFAMVQATADNTQVRVDANNDGIWENLDWTRDGVADGTVRYLNKGEVFLVDRTSLMSASLNSGTKIVGNDTLQVQYVVGDQGSNYESRGFSAFPRGFWDTRYYAPVSGASVARYVDIYLHNPQDSGITITYETDSAQGTFNIAAHTTVSFRDSAGFFVPAGSAMFLKGTAPFWGVSSIDTAYHTEANGQANDWGYSLVPAFMLDNEHFMGWAPGSDPVNYTAGDRDDSGVYITAAQDNTVVFVDRNNDGTVDYQRTLNRLESWYVWDQTDGDLSQANIWSTGPVAMAYGQNPDYAPDAVPAIDVGYTTIPSKDMIELVLQVAKETDPVALSTTAGDTAEYTITVSSYDFEVDNTFVVDTLPAGWSFVNNSATITDANRIVTTGAAANPTVTGGGLVLTWPTSLCGSMQPNQTITIVFTAQNTVGRTNGEYTRNKVAATGTRTVGGVTQTFVTSDFVYNTYGDLQMTKVSGGQDPLAPGDTYTYSITVTNPATAAASATGIAIYDAMPSGITWVPGSSYVTMSNPPAVSSIHVRDEFNTNGSYAGNDGPDNWSANWVESDNGGGGAGGGNVRVTGNELRLRANVGNYAARAVNLTAMATATLSFDWRTGSGVDNSDWAVVEISSNGTAGPFTVLETFANIGASQSGSRSYDIRGYISNNTAVRFRITQGYNNTNEYFYVDNVDILATLGTSGPASDPPNFLSQSDGYSLAPGESLTLTFQVTVDDPLPTGVTDILNTAYLTTNEMPVPMHDHAYNIVVNPGTSSASVGDTVWLDVNGDGVQQAGEMGLGNVEVTLKDQWGTPKAVTLTDSWGNYVFTGVQPGTGYYVDVTGGLPAGLGQTYPVGRSDNQTDAFNLAAAQVYLDADLGFAPASGTVTIGDRVWSDANGDGVQDAGEPGIAGVTVTLWRDDGDGLFEPGGGDTLVDTQVTTAGGFYLFTGVDPAYPDYFVLVDDTQSALTGYSSTTGTVAIVPDVSAGDVILNADFGFTNPAGTYTIKDRVWFDPDSDGNDDVSAGDNAETGIYGVTVELLDASRRVIAVTMTDADGYFSFTGVPGGGADYTIRVSDTNGVLKDYYGTTSWGIAREFAVDNLSANADNTAEPAEPHFGYNLKGSIGDTVYNDINGNGAQDAGEPGIGGVEVRVYHDVNGDGLLDGGDALEATLVTDVNGRYLFSALADGNYIVSLPTPPSLTTYTSEGPGGDDDPAAGVQQASVLSSGGADLARDFGFAANNPRSISGTVWWDADENGLVGGTEGLFSGVTVELWQGTALVASTVTNAIGTYVFAGLTPGTYTVRLTDDTKVLNDYNTVYEVTEGSGAGSYNSQESVDASGASVGDINFGYKKQPATYAELSSFTVKLVDGLVTAEWRTVTEAGTIGFFLTRQEGRKAAVTLGGGLLPGLLTSRSGGIYTFKDDTAAAGHTYVYTLEEVEAKGGKTLLGTAKLALGKTDTVATGGYLPLSEAYTREANAEFSNAIPAVFRPTVLYQTDQTGPAGEAPLEKTLAAMLSAAVVSPENLTKQGANEPGVAKILVETTGIYYLSAAALSPVLGIPEADVRVLISGGQLAMALTGLPVAWQAVGGDEGLAFYGLAPASTFTRYNVYWLGKGQVVNPGGGAGGGSGSRSKENTGSNGCFLGTVMKVLASVGAVEDEPAFFRDTRHFEEDHWDISALFEDPYADFWVWDVIYAGFPGFDRKEFTIRADGVAAGLDAAVLTVRLHGGSDIQSVVDHHVTVAVNGVQIGDARFDGTVSETMTLSFDPGILVDGENTVTVTGILDNGVDYSVFYIESFDLSYDRAYAAYQDSLEFPANGAAQVGVGGFSNDDIWVFDIDDPLQPKKVASPTVQDDGGSFSVHFTPGNPQARFLAVERNAFRAPAFLETEVPSTLSSRSNRADYLVIAPDVLMDAARGLADYRAAQGLSTLVVSLTDVMDEFNYGIFDPFALRDFLKTAYRTWDGPPRYAVLIGKGTSDYKDCQGFGDNLMPPVLVPTPDGLYASDNRLGAVGPDEETRVIAVGRLPVVNAGQMNTMLQKIMGYESDGGGDWTGRVMMVADNSDDAGDFTADSDAVAALVPAPYVLKTTHIPQNATGAQLTTARNQVKANINAGAVVMNYIGHGGWDRLANEGLLTINDVPALVNGTKLPFLAAMTCVVGQSMPGFDSISEALLLSGAGGASAVFAPTGLSLNSEAVMLDKALFTAIFQDGETVVGDAVTAALNSFRLTSSWPFMQDIYTLYGDPAMRMQ
ncbi:MAG: C25 family cysteine peptidase [Thermodesulfobacteriota bacterium]